MMLKNTIFLFGAAEKGEFCSPFTLTSLDELLEYLGNPPENSEGIHCAIQALLYEMELIYFRISEEGFSFEEYMQGLRYLRQKKLKKRLSALCLPGVGDQEIIQAAIPICHMYESVLLVTEKDLYDYLTAK